MHSQCGVNKKIFAEFFRHFCGDKNCDNNPYQVELLVHVYQDHPLLKHIMMQHIFTAQMILVRSINLQRMTMYNDD